MFQEGLKLNKEEEYLAHLQGGIYDMREEINSLDEEFKNAVIKDPTQDVSTRIKSSLMMEVQELEDILEAFCRQKAKLDAKANEWSLAIKTLKNINSSR